MGKLYFHIEIYAFGVWSAHKVRLAEQHNFARFVEWMEKERAIEFAEDMIKAHETGTSYLKLQLRVTDHLGEQVWQKTGERKTAK